MTVKKHLIYALVDPATSEIRYVGRSSSGLARAKSHSRPSGLKTDDYCHRWIRKLLAETGLRPGIRVVQEFDAFDDIDSVLNDAEVYWVSYFRGIGCPLTNTTDGGRGLSGYRHTEEAKRMIGQKNSIALQGHIPWNKGTAKKTDYTCTGCDKIFIASASYYRKFCSAMCYITYTSVNGPSDESRKKNSDSVKKRIEELGHGFTKDVPQLRLRKPVICLNDHIVHPSIYHAAEVHDICRDTIGQQCRRRRGKTRSGLEFRFVSDFTKNIRSPVYSMAA